jgi:hypothetical protein
MSKIEGYENADLTPWNGPPYSYSVTIKNKTIRMMGFNEQHIKDQLYPKKPTRIIKLKERD